MKEVHSIMRPYRVNQWGGEGTAGNTTFKKLQLNWYLKHKQDLAQQDKWPGKKKVGTSVSSVLRQRFRVQRKKRIQETK